jgi:hypothetical protein
MSLVVYSGNSVDLESVKYINDNLVEIGYSTDQIDYPKNSRDLAAFLQQVEGALIFPAGKVRSVYEELKPYQEVIQKAIEKGWNCLAVGGSAHLFCQNFAEKIEKKGGKISQKMETFWKLLPFTSYISLKETTERVKGVASLYRNKLKFKAYFNVAEGARFVPEEESLIIKTDVEAYLEQTKEDLAKKEDPKPMAISGKYGKGTVIACGFQPEIPIVKKDEDDEKESSTSSENKEFLRLMFNKIGIQSKLAKSQEELTSENPRKSLGHRLILGNFFQKRTEAVGPISGK